MAADFLTSSVREQSGDWVIAVRTDGDMEASGVNQMAEHLVMSK